MPVILHILSHLIFTTTIELRYYYHVPTTFLLYKWGKWDPEKLNILFKVIWLLYQLGIAKLMLHNKYWQTQQLKTRNSSLLTCLLMDWCTYLHWAQLGGSSSFDRLPGLDHRLLLEFMFTLCVLIFRGVVISWQMVGMQEANQSIPVHFKVSTYITSACNLLAKASYRATHIQAEKGFLRNSLLSPSCPLQK